jgi:hypothetical protein
MFISYVVEIRSNLHLSLSFSIILFLVAFFFICFQDSSAATRIPVGSLCAAVGILVSWCVWTTWERRREEQPIPAFADEEEKTVADDLLSSERTEIRPSLFDRLTSLSGQGRQDDIEMAGV